MPAPQCIIRTLRPFPGPDGRHTAEYGSINYVRKSCKNKKIPTGFATGGSLPFTLTAMVNTQRLLTSISCRVRLTGFPDTAEKTFVLRVSHYRFPVLLIRQPVAVCLSRPAVRDKRYYLFDPEVLCRTANHVVKAPDTKMRGASDVRISPFKGIMRQARTVRLFEKSLSFLVHIAP